MKDETLKKVNTIITDLGSIKDSIADIVTAEHRTDADDSHATMVELWAAEDGITTLIGDLMKTYDRGVQSTYAGSLDFLKEDNAS